MTNRIDLVDFVIAMRSAFVRGYESLTAAHEGFADPREGRLVVRADEITDQTLLRRCEEVMEAIGAAAMPAPGMGLRFVQKGDELVFFVDAGKIRRR